MNRPEGISESAWDAASGHAIKYVDWIGRPKVDADAEYVLTTTIALALQSSVEAERAKIADFCEAQAPTVVGKLFADLIRKGA